MPPPAPGPLPTVILAGGAGTRLRPLSDDVPKPMVEIGGRPVLWHVLRIYLHYGHHEFLIAAGRRHDVIDRYFRGAPAEALRASVPPRITVHDTGVDTMTAGRLRRVADRLRDRTFMATYADGLADVDLDALVAFHRGHGRLATMTAVRIPSPFGHPQLDGDRVVAFAEKPLRADDDRINAGFFVFEPAVLARIEGGGESLEEVTLPRLAAAGELMAFRHDGFWHPMDTPGDRRELQALWDAGAAPWVRS